MSNSILPPEGLQKPFGQYGSQGNNLKDLLQSKLEADSLEKGFPTDQQNQTDEFTPSPQGVRAAAAMQHYQAAYQYSETMSLQLQTKEGDVVNVNFRQLFAYYESYKEEQAAAEEGPKGVRYFESREALETTQFEEHFAFSVEGDLNENELKAIFDVFEQVDELATSFFNGDIEKAFQQAVEMDVDFAQLQSVDLDLQRTETVATSYQQAATYQGVQQAGQPAIEDNGESEDVSVADLPTYLQRMQQAVESLDAFFEEARTAVEEFMAAVTSQRDPENQEPSTWLERIRNFHEMLLEKAGLDKTTLSPSGVEINPEVEEPDVVAEQSTEGDATQSEDENLVE